MNIVITGSLGHIGKPLTDELVQKKHHVTVISSKPEKQAEIEVLGATPAIGSVEDVAFLASAFTGADAVFCMIPPNFSAPDQVAYYSRVGNNYAQAIEQARVKRVVDLSSYGAHLERGTGFIVGSHRVENRLDALINVAVTHIRPGYFYYNLYGFIGMISAAGFMGANYGGDDKLALVSPVDIAAAVADELTTLETDRHVRYVASDERSCTEVAQVLGQAIGKPDLTWVIISSEQMKKGLEANGVPAHVAAALAELGSATHSGALRADYERHKPVMGQVKLEDFAPEFADAFTLKQAH
ncbi:NmrA family NAD(P)-binding protein [Spirosoma areae]